MIVPFLKIQINEQEIELSDNIRKTFQPINNVNHTILSIDSEIQKIVTCPNCKKEKEKLKYIYKHESVLLDLKTEMEKLITERNNYVISTNDEESIKLSKLKNCLASLNNCYRIYNEKQINLKKCISVEKPELLKYLNSSYSPIVMGFPDFIIAIYNDFFLLFDTDNCFIGAYSFFDFKINIVKNTKKVYFRIEHKYESLITMINFQEIKKQLDDNGQGYDSDYIVFDSKCIEKGQTGFSYLHERVDGGPDRRYRDNPYTMYRTDNMQFGVLTFSFGNIEYTFNISSNKCINLFDDYINYTKRERERHVNLLKDN